MASAVKDPVSIAPHYVLFFTANQRVSLLLYVHFSLLRELCWLMPIPIYVRPMQEYGSVVWSPYEAGEISFTEKVQRTTVR